MCYCASTYHAKYNENVTGAKECVIAAEFFETRSDLHGGKNETEEYEYDEYPGEVSLEEDDVAIVSISVRGLLANMSNPASAPNEQGLTYRYPLTKCVCAYRIR
jgi:hypothetical protein